MSRLRIRNFEGGGLIKSIHPPADPELGVLPADARRFWEGVRSSALSYYGSSGAPKPKLVAERTAWRAVRMHWGPSGGRSTLAGLFQSKPWVRRTSPWAKPKKMAMPKAGDLITLGKLVEYVWINPDGTLEVRRWKSNPPDLRWNHEQKTLYTFPNVPDKSSCEAIPQDMRSQAKLFETWAQRPGRCLETFDVTTNSSILPMGVGDSVAYRSDKWHDRSPAHGLEGSEEYFHQFTDGNVIWQDSDNAPNAILMRGGQLDVEARGIIH